MVFGGSYGIGADIDARAAFGAPSLVQPLDHNTDVGAATTSGRGRDTRPARLVDFVVNSAGVLPRGDLLETTEERSTPPRDQLRRADLHRSGVLSAPEGVPRQPAAVHLELLHAGSRGYSLTPRRRLRGQPHPGPRRRVGRSTAARQLHQPRADRDPDAHAGVRRGALESLLGSEVVARASLDTLLGPGTGHVVDLRKSDPIEAAMQAGTADYED